MLLQHRGQWKDCFVGRDAVTFFRARNYVNSRHGGLLLGRQLVQKGYIKYAGIEHRDFEDEILFFYQFTDNLQLDGICTVDGTVNSIVNGSGSEENVFSGVVAGYIPNGTVGVETDYKTLSVVQSISPDSRSLNVTLPNESDNDRNAVESSKSQSHSPFTTNPNGTGIGSPNGVPNGIQNGIPNGLQNGLQNPQTPLSHQTPRNLTTETPGTSSDVLVVSPGMVKNSGSTTVSPPIPTTRLEFSQSASELSAIIDSMRDTITRSSHRSNTLCQREDIYSGKEVGLLCLDLIFCEMSKFPNFQHF